MLVFLNSGQIVLINHKTIIKEKERKLVRDLRHVISLPTNSVISISDEEKIRFATEQLKKIQSLYENEQIEQAYH